MKNQLQVDPQTTSELGYCTAPQHKSQPFIAVCPKYCGYHPSQLLCETCITQCQDQNAIIRFVPRTKPDYVESDKMTCKTESHNNLLIVGICTISSCKNHDNELVCQMCIEQCENSQGIKLFKDQIKGYNNFLDKLLKEQDERTQQIDVLQKSIPNFIKRIKSQENRLENWIKDQIFDPDNLKQKEIDILLNLLQTGKVESLVAEFKKDFNILLNAVSLLEKYFSNPDQFSKEFLISAKQLQEAEKEPIMQASDSKDPIALDQLKQDKNEPNTIMQASQVKKSMTSGLKHSIALFELKLAQRQPNTILQAQVIEKSQTAPELINPQAAQKLKISIALDQQNFLSQAFAPTLTQFLDLQLACYQQGDLESETKHKLQKTLSLPRLSLDY